MTRPTALLLMAVVSSALRFALSSFAAALLAPVVCAAALLKLRLLLRREGRGADDLGRLRSYYAAGGRRLWVAVHDGEDVCGCVAFDPEPGGAGGRGPPAVELRRMAVSRWYRRSGVATCMLGFFEGRARAEGYGRVVLRVDAVNRAAIALYEKNGYRPRAGAGRLCHSLALEYSKDLC
ncbi:probable N-acetyltransferase 14 [Heptranchias perlo]|uniref:probable N-acetyltransferase 14 n=1 Tax=Heptranchias perlo TaxID=212740 RepID=UPI003559C5CF